MTRLNRERDVIRMAAELEVPYDSDPVGEIIQFCERRIANWLDEAPSVQNIQELEALVCDRLQLRVEEFWSDRQLEELVDRYTKAGEPAFQGLLDDFDPTTFATLMQRKNVESSAADVYVAVVDCRAPKTARRFFSRWHEIAHLLTMTRQLELPYHRSTDKPPLERLMDHIAGEIGFFPPLFLPELELRLRRERYLSFAAVEDIRKSFCASASFHSTLVACAKRVSVPVVHVEAGLGLKAEERRQVNSAQGRLFAAPPPMPKLRALVAVSNPAARALGLRIDRNMEVPASSAINALFNADGAMPLEDVISMERLESWRHKNGIAVGHGEIRVEARRVHDSILAILQPIAVRRRPQTRMLASASPQSQSDEFRSHSRTLLRDRIVRVAGHHREAL